MNCPDRRTFMAGATIAALSPLVFTEARAQAPVIATSLEDLAVTPSAPALGLLDLAGKRHETADFKGKAFVVSFWATWCPPCRREMPSLQNLRARLKPDNIEVLAINYGETEDPINRFLKKAGVADLPILLDSDEEASRRWYVGNLPIAYAVDPAGIVRLGKKGEVDWDSAEIDAQLRKLAAG